MNQLFKKYAAVSYLFHTILLGVVVLFSLFYAQPIYISFAALEILPSATIDTTFPTRAKPNNTENITDLSYWLDTLTHEEDKTAAWYVVYPKVGVTIPIVWPDDADVKKIQAAELFDHYKYLENGALHYVGNAPDQGIGNMVLAVHSSFAKSDPWRYKTAGQVAPLSIKGDKVFVYLADETGTYTLYVYSIHRSEQISETAVDILNQEVATKSLTLFTCYPIWTTDARRVNQAELIETIPSDKRYAPVPAFTTQSVNDKPLVIKSKENTSKEHNAAPTVTTWWTATWDTQSVITPTFKERVILRPVVYRTAMKLISTIGFKRANLQKLTDALEEKITTLSAQHTTTKRTTIISFILIQEIVTWFMK